MNLSLLRGKVITYFSSVRNESVVASMALGIFNLYSLLSHLRGHLRTQLSKTKLDRDTDKTFDKT